MISDLKIHKGFVTVQSQAKFHKTGIKCAAFWRLALNSYKFCYSQKEASGRKDFLPRIKMSKEGNKTCGNS